MDFNENLTLQKQARFLAAVQAAARTLSVPVPRVEFHPDKCPYDEGTEWAHIHLDSGIICVSSKRLAEMSFEQIDETAKHEVTHLVDPTHDPSFHGTLHDVRAKTWSPPGGVVVIDGGARPKPKSKPEPYKPDKKQCNYYQVCDSKGPLKECKYCHKYFCEEHIAAKVPHLMNLSTASYAEIEEWNRKDRHPCPDFYDYYVATKKRRDEKWGDTLNVLTGHKKRPQKNGSIPQPRSKKGPLQKMTSPHRKVVDLGIMDKEDVKELSGMEVDDVLLNHSELRNKKEKERSNLSLAHQKAIKLGIIGPKEAENTPLKKIEELLREYNESHKKHDEKSNEKGDEYENKVIAISKKHHNTLPKNNSVSFTDVISENERNNDDNISDEKISHKSKKTGIITMIILAIIMMSLFGYYYYEKQSKNEPLIIENITYAPPESIEPVMIELPVAISYSDLVSNWGGDLGEEITIQGKLYSAMTDTGNGIKIRKYFVVDDFGLQIGLLRLNADQQNQFLDSATTKELYEITGIISHVSVNNPTIDVTRLNKI